MHLIDKDSKNLFHRGDLYGLIELDDICGRDLDTFDPDDGSQFDPDGEGDIDHLGVNLREMYAEVNELHIITSTDYLGTDCKPFLEERQFSVREFDPEPLLLDQSMCDGACAWVQGGCLWTRVHVRRWFLADGLTKSTYV